MVAYVADNPVISCDVAVCVEYILDKPDISFCTILCSSVTMFVKSPTRFCRRSTFSTVA